ncbi:MAG: hypothetical protein R3C58_08535 [Parvularculaceae bacterium]
MCPAVCPGVSRTIAFRLAEHHRVAFADRAVEARNAFGLGARADDFAIPFFLEREVAARVIGMPVRVEDVGEAPTFLRQRSVDGVRVGRVDRRRRAGLAVMDEIAVIIRKTGKLLDHDRHRRTPEWLTIDGTLRAPA